MTHKQWCSKTKVPCPFEACRICKAAWHIAQREERRKTVRRKPPVQHRKVSTVRDCFNCAHTSFEPRFCYECFVRHNWMSRTAKTVA
jgi:hypothetical protein